MTQPTDTMMKYLLLAAALIGLGGCASSSSTSAIQYSNTMDIIGSAATQAPQVVAGDYTLLIKAVGEQGAMVFLNTELDYRDQRNVTIALPKQVLPQMGIADFNALQHHFVNHAVHVRGDAMRVRIDFNRDHVPTGKYYYQTHIHIAKLSDISVIAEQ
ncbi:hypothetical protein [Shewanella sp.]|uniref:hypothetical protein n=1 Tax=Shewanella sp. TaxID=50422 RepID=UPI003A97C0A2